MDINKLLPLLPDLATFVTIAEENSFSACANKLGIAPSSVSRTLAKLEKALNVKLLDRTTRKIQLTSTGNEVYAISVQMMESAQLAVKAAQSQQQDLSGTIRVAAPKALAKQVLAPIILDFIEQTPNVEVELKAIDHIIDPFSHEVDVLIHITPTPIEGLVAIKLFDVDLLLCATPQYLSEKSTPTHPNDLLNHACISLSEEQKDKVWQFHKGQQQSTVTVSGPLAVNHTEIRREAVARHMGIAPFPSFCVEDRINNGELVQVLREWKLTGKFQGQVVAQYLQSKYVPAQIKAFVQHCKVQLANR